MIVGNFQGEGDMASQGWGDPLVPHPLCKSLCICTQVYHSLIVGRLNGPDITYTIHYKIPMFIHVCIWNTISDAGIICSSPFITSFRNQNHIFSAALDPYSWDYRLICGYLWDMTISSVLVKSYGELYVYVHRHRRHTYEQLHYHNIGENLQYAFVNPWIKVHVVI